MSLADKFIKSSKKIKGGGLFSNVVEEGPTYCDTGVYALNLAYSSHLDGGPSDGVTCIAGKSRSFKTLFGLISAAAYLNKYEDAYMVFFDSEKGASKAYFESVGIDPARVIYVPIMNIEELKFYMMEMLEAAKQEYNATKEYSRFVFFVDSIGNLASIKEVNDSLSGNSASDMGTRAKSLKALFRIITPYFTNYEMHLIAIMHTYDEMAAMGAPKQIMSGGTGPMYSSNNVFIVSKQQIKEGTEIVGWRFILNIEKSRTIREKAKIPFEVNYDSGMDKYTGLLDMALITGHVTKPKVGWFTRPSVEGDKSWRRANTSTDEFWEPLLAEEGEGSFRQMVSDMYRLNSKSTLLQSGIDELISETEES